MKKLFGVLAAGVLFGCGAIPRSSGVLPLGPDTYRVSVRASMGEVTQSQRLATTEAEAHCRAAQRELMVIGTRLIRDAAGGPYEVTFRCLAHGDLDLQRPNLVPTPDATIQLR